MKELKCRVWQIIGLMLQSSCTKRAGWRHIESCHMRAHKLELLQGALHERS